MSKPCPIKVLGEFESTILGGKKCGVGRCPCGLYTRFRLDLPAPTMCRVCATEERDNRIGEAWHHAREMKEMIERTGADRFAMRTRKATLDAVADGRLVRGVCACGEPDTHAHHESYLDPMAIVWLCPGCHKSRHVELNAADASPMHVLARYLDAHPSERMPPRRVVTVARRAKVA